MQSIEKFRLLTAAPLVVYEWSGRWARLFERLLLAETVRPSQRASRTAARSSRASRTAAVMRVISCRHADECLERAVEFPAAFVAVELAAGRVDAALRLLDDLSVGHPGATTAALAERDFASYEGLVRELGAVALAMSTADARLLCNVAGRRARRIERDYRTAWAALSPEDWRQQLLAELPWR